MSAPYRVRVILPKGGHIERFATARAAKLWTAKANATKDTRATYLGDERKSTRAAIAACEVQS